MCNLLEPSNKEFATRMNFSLNIKCEKVETIITSDEMYMADRRAIEEFGIPSILLMENAALALFRVIKKEYPKAKRVLVLVGKGNKGGDGLALTRHLLLNGYNVDYVLCLGDDLKGDAKRQLDILLKLGKKPLQYAELLRYDLIVDALLGIGFQPPLKHSVSDWINRMNTCGLPIVAVDVPSGLLADTPQTSENHVRAHTTVTFMAPKICHVFYPSAKSCGKVYVANISIPEFILSHVNREIITRVELPPRAPDVHKGLTGHVLLVGSSVGKTGAIIMSAKASTRTGSGLVTVGVPKGLNSVFETVLTEEMSLPLDGDERLSYECLEKIISLQEKFSALGVGMGMGRYEDGQRIVVELVKHWEKPLLLDADALNNLADAKALDFLKYRSVPAVLTPHVGEFSRLTGIGKEEILSRPTEVACEFSQRYNSYVVLKFSRTIIATPEGRVFVSTYGTPAMAKGGMGDVLSGILTSLMGRGMDTLSALKLGVVLHGLSGQVAEERYHMESLKALDLVESIPTAYNLIQHGNYSPPFFPVD